VIGSPVRHSLSPAIHNAAFAASGSDWAYLAFEVEEAGVVAALAGGAVLGLRGLSVTMPLKAAVAAAVDVLSPVAAVLGAVNTVTFGPDRTLGDNTDGGGFLDAVAAAGVTLGGVRAVVLGAGGAARAVVAALAGVGADRVTVVNRTQARAAAAADLAGAAGRVGAEGDVAAADLVVNATPIGMAATPGAGRLPPGGELVHAGQVVVDLVYHPVRTPLLIEAGRRGATVVDGVGMLVYQAARQFERWTGQPAPVEVMYGAARGALAPQPGP